MARLRCILVRMVVLVDCKQNVVAGCHGIVNSRPSWTGALAGGAKSLSQDSAGVAMEAAFSRTTSVVQSLVQSPYPFLAISRRNSVKLVPNGFWEAPSGSPIINAVLLKSLPARDPGSLVVLGPSRGSGSGVGIPRDGSFSLYSYDLYKHLQDTKAFDGLCALQSTTETGVSVRRSGWSDPQFAHARLVSGNYFEVLGVNAIMGRALNPLDDSASAPPVAVVSFPFWKNRLGGDRAVTGSNIYIGGAPFTIVGVTPPEFYGETLEPDPPNFWLPISSDRQLNRQRAPIDQPDVHWLYVIGRLSPITTARQAQDRLTITLRNWLLARNGSTLSPEQRRNIMRAYVELTPGGSGIVHMQRAYSVTLRLLLGISISVLLITCANVANLLLARGTARMTETSVRLALGATWSRFDAAGAYGKLDACAPGGCDRVIGRRSRHKAADHAPVPRSGLRSDPDLARPSRPHIYSCSLVWCCNRVRLTPELPSDLTACTSDQRREPWDQGLTMRSPGRPEAIVAEVRHALAEIDPRLLLLRVSTLSEHINRELNQESVIPTLAMAFGLVALVLSALGLYRLMAYNVQRRTSEIGIRIALGARRALVIRLVVGEAFDAGPDRSRGRYSGRFCLS